MYLRSVSMYHVLCIMYNVFLLLIHKPQGKQGNELQAPRLTLLYFHAGSRVLAVGEF